MRILVTGASGFIGKPLVRSLLDQGHEVLAFCRHPEKLLTDGITGAVLKKGDLTDAGQVKGAVEGCHQVYHLGALARTWSPQAAHFDRVNIEGTRHILEASLRTGVNRVLHASTVMAIGPSDGFVADESTPLSPTPLSHYQRTKAEAERLAVHYGRKGLDVVIASPSLVFGPSAGERRVSFNRFLQDFIQGKPVVIPGNGKQLMNCVFLDDVVDGLLRVMHGAQAGEKYILGGDNLSVEELGRLVNRITGASRRVVHIPFWAGRMAGLVEIARARMTGGTPLVTWSSIETYRHSWAYASEKAVRELGYRKRPLEEGLRVTIQWLEDH
jgi:nucleoside-diphosphate-sugar epimerase